MILVTKGDTVVLAFEGVQEGIEEETLKVVEIMILEQMMAGWLRLRQDSSNTQYWVSTLVYMAPCTFLGRVKGLRMLSCNFLGPGGCKCLEQRYQDAYTVELNMIKKRLNSMSNFGLPKVNGTDRQKMLKERITEKTLPGWGAP
jgi:hypothetical protein